MVSLQDLNNEVKTDRPVMLVCPVCHNELVLENPYRRSGRVRTGYLRCLAGCGKFRVIYGVPVMVSPGETARWWSVRSAWNGYVQRNGKEKALEALAAGEFDKDPRPMEPPVPEDRLKKAKQIMSEKGWQRYLKTVNKYSIEAHNPMRDALVDRMQQIQGGVVLEIGSGGGFTSERMLAGTQPLLTFVAVDISFECVKLAEKRASLLGKGDRSFEICTDVRQLPFADKSLTAAYSHVGFWHVQDYPAALTEVYRVLERGARFLATEAKEPRLLGSKYSLTLEELREVAHRLKLVFNGQEFVEQVRQAGFEVITVDEVRSLSGSPYLLVEAVKGGG